MQSKAAYTLKTARGQGRGKCGTMKNKLNNTSATRSRSLSQVDGPKMGQILLFHKNGLSSRKHVAKTFHVQIPKPVCQREQSMSGQQKSTPSGSSSMAAITKARIARLDMQKLSWMTTKMMVATATGRSNVILTSPLKHTAPTLVP